MASGHIQKEGLEPARQGQFVVSGYTELGCCPENCSHTVYRRLDGGETEEEKEVVTVGAGEITRPDGPHPRAQPAKCQHQVPSPILFGFQTLQKTPVGLAISFLARSKTK